MAAIFDYPYRKSVNITAWVLQFIVCLILLGASAWVIAATTKWDLDSLYAYVVPKQHLARQKASWRMGGQVNGATAHFNTICTNLGTPKS